MRRSAIRPAREPLSWIPWTRDPRLIPPPSPRALQAIRILNDVEAAIEVLGPRLGPLAWDRLRTFFGSWIDCGQDYVRWRSSSPEGARAFDWALGQLRARPIVVGSTGHHRVGLSEAVPSLYAKRPSERARRIAGYFFLKLATSPWTVALRRCPRQSCGRYFVGPRNKLYHARQCGTVVGVEAARDEERESKLARLKRAIERSSDLKELPNDLRGWVCRQAKVDKRFLAHHEKGEDPVIEPFSNFVKASDLLQALYRRVTRARDFKQALPGSTLEDLENSVYVLRQNTPPRSKRSAGERITNFETGTRSVRGLSESTRHLLADFVDAARKIVEMSATAD